MLRNYIDPPDLSRRLLDESIHCAGPLFPDGGQRGLLHRDQEDGGPHGELQAGHRTQNTR